MEYHSGYREQDDDPRWAVVVLAGGVHQADGVKQGWEQSPDIGEFRGF